jgi:hypothetical protein
LQELGDKPTDLLELDIASAIFGGNRDNGVGLGASGRSRREVDADRSSSASGKDKGEISGEASQGEGATEALKGIKRHGFE